MEDVDRERIGSKRGDGPGSLADRTLRVNAGRDTGRQGERRRPGHGLPGADPGDDRDRETAGRRLDGRKAPSISVNLQISGWTRGGDLGSGDIGLIMAAADPGGDEGEGGFRDQAVVGGLERNVRQCLRDFGIPLELSTTVWTSGPGPRFVGRGRTGRRDLRRSPGRSGTFPATPCFFPSGLIPENELSREPASSFHP